MNLKGQEENSLDQVIDLLNEVSNKYGLDFSKIKITKTKVNKKCKYVREFYTYKGEEKVRIVYRCQK